MERIETEFGRVHAIVYPAEKMTWGKWREDRDRYASEQVPTICFARQCPIDDDDGVVLIIGNGGPLMTNFEIPLSAVTELGEEEAVRRACSFLGRRQEEVKKLACGIPEGYLTAVLRGRPKDLHFDEDSVAVNKFLREAGPEFAGKYVAVHTQLGIVASSTSLKDLHQTVRGREDADKIVIDNLPEIP